MPKLRFPTEKITTEKEAGDDQCFFHSRQFTAIVRNYLQNFVEKTKEAGQRILYQSFDKAQPVQGYRI